MVCVPEQREPRAERGAEQTGLDAAEERARPGDAVAGQEVGEAAEVRADAMPEKVYKGKVTFIAPTATTVGTIRTYLVRVAVDSQEGLRAGMSARVDILTE